MEPISIATTIAVLFLTKALEKTGEKFGEGIVGKMGAAIAKIRHHSPETAAALEAGDKKVLELDAAALAKIPAETIFAEFVAAADAEPNVALQAKLPDVKAGKIVQVMASGIEGTNLRAKSMKQTAPSGSESVEQTMLKDVKVTGDIDLGDLTQG
jgi:hypothetical protein